MRKSHLIRSLDRLFDMHGDFLALLGQVDTRNPLIILVRAAFDEACFFHAVHHDGQGRAFIVDASRKLAMAKSVLYGQSKQQRGCPG